jgi:hypothetical protein
MKTKTRKTLPKTAAEITNGSIHIQLIRCGKDSCKCSRGELHTGHYFFTRIRGKLEKFYIRKTELEGFSKIVNQAKSNREDERKRQAFSNNILSEYRSFLTDNSKTINQLKEELN